MLIETIERFGNPLYIAHDKVSVILQHRDDPEKAVIFFGNASDEDGWTIYESVQSFRAKYEAAQAEESTSDVG